MGWYSLRKWYRPWSMKKHWNWVGWYSESLKTPEQREQERLEKERSSKRAMRTLGYMMALTEYMGDRTGYRFR